MKGSELKWDSLKIRKLLRAVSGLHDDELIKHNEDPIHLRNLFYSFFSQKYEMIKEPAIELKQQIKFENYLVFNLCKSSRVYIDGWTDPEDTEEYLLIGETKEGQFIAKKIEFIMSGQYDISGRWSIFKEQKADFVHLTILYHQIIIEICEKWGYDRIVQWIRNY